MERLATRCDDGEPGCGAKEVGDEWCATEDLLEVVEDEQHATVGQVVLERGPDRPAGVLAKADRVGDRTGMRSGSPVVDRSTKKTPPAKSGRRSSRDAETEARLARAAGADQGHQP